MRWRHAIHHPRADRGQRLSGIRGRRADEGGVARLCARKISQLFRLKISGGEGAKPRGADIYRCLGRVLLYDGIVTAVPPCQIAPAQGRPANKNMFKRILIANRGEIACRVIKTARRMGIETIAVYAEADRDALHVEMADDAVLIGPPAAAESYLSMEKIIEACKRTGAEAVHPGYGFLSEREAFPTALAKAGIVFIGPNPKAIAAMGDKIESKKAAAKAKVSTVPGHLGVIEDERNAVKIADEIGYPVMIKASAGGGGKGMRIAHSKTEVAEGFN